MQHLEQWRSLKPKENDVTQCMYTKMTGIVQYYLVVVFSYLQDIKSILPRMNRDDSKLTITIQNITRPRISFKN